MKMSKPVKNSAKKPSPDNGKEQPSADHYVLRLYVTGVTPKSTRAIANLKSICDEHLQGRYQLEVIDVYQQPELAKREDIIAMPTLVKQLPLPLRRLVGDLSQHNKVLLGLGLQIQAE